MCVLSKQVCTSLVNLLRGSLLTYLSKYMHVLPFKQECSIASTTLLDVPILKKLLENTI